MNAHYHRIFGPDRDELRRRGWRTRDYTVRQGRRYIERIAEEAIDPEVLADADDPFLSAMGRCCLRYEAFSENAAPLTCRVYRSKPTLCYCKTTQSLKAFSGATVSQRDCRATSQ